jgi:hypothetical protein
VDVCDCGFARFELVDGVVGGRWGMWVVGDWDSAGWSKNARLVVF